MTRILLTGAGFSRNWGGWLASEAFEYVLGRPEVSEELRRLLWEDHTRGYGFEDTLGKLQRLHKEEGDQAAAVLVNEFTMALVAMFNEMNAGLSRAELEWQTDNSMMVKPFLAQFDYIFSLNQDLLLECHYFTQFPIGSKFAGAQTPGLKPFNPSPLISPEAPQHAKWTPDYNALRLNAGQQPYIKLHGSSNWLRGGPEPRLLVLGGSKSVEIAQDPLLTWYHQVFRDALHLSGARLMIIGYGFADRHINEVIAQAADRGTLTVFVVDPNSGVDLVFKPQEPPIPLWDKIPARVRGGSRRPLSSTFGQDRVEHNKLVAFLAD
jgi:hypothetical protein